MQLHLKQILLATSLLVVFVPKVEAGQLFPPSNHSACTGLNTYLAWNQTGDGLGSNPGSTVDCVTLATPSCPTGQVMTSITGGAPVCTLQANPNSSCPAGQIMTGLANGIPACTTPNPQVNVSCPSGQVMVSLPNNTTAVCANPLANLNDNCPAGQVMVSVNGSGATCANPTSDVTTSCPAGQALRGITNGVPNCVAVVSSSSSGFPVNHAAIGSPANSVGNGSTACVAYTDANGRAYISKGDLGALSWGWWGIQWQSGHIIVNAYTSTNNGNGSVSSSSTCLVDTTGLSIVTAYQGSNNQSDFYPW